MPCGLKQKSYRLLRQKLYQDDETQVRPQRLGTGYTTVPVPLCKDKIHFTVLELRLYHANEEEVINTDIVPLYHFSETEDILYVPDCYYVYHCANKAVTTF